MRIIGCLSASLLVLCGAKFHWIGFIKTRIVSCSNYVAGPIHGFQLRTLLQEWPLQHIYIYIICILGAQSTRNEYVCLHWLLWQRLHKGVDCWRDLVFMSQLFIPLRFHSWVLALQVGAEVLPVTELHMTGLRLPHNFDAFPVRSCPLVSSDNLYGA